MSVDLTVVRGHVTATVAAGLLGVSRQRINQLLNTGRLDGAFLIDCGDGRELWAIPRTTIEERKQKHDRKKQDARRAGAQGTREAHA